MSPSLTTWSLGCRPGIELREPNSADQMFTFLVTSLLFSSHFGREGCPYEA